MLILLALKHIALLIDIYLLSPTGPDFEPATPGACMFALGSCQPTVFAVLNGMLGHCSGDWFGGKTNAKSKSQTQLPSKLLFWLAF